MPRQPTIVAVAMIDSDRQAKRRGYWLHLARMRAGKTRLKQVADALGYSQRSISTISLWEQGLRDPPIKQLEKLAALYEVPMEVFMEPDPTDMERLEERIAEINARRNRREIRPAG